MSGGGQEHRRAPRRPVFGNAVIRGPNLHADCVIRDLSASGARIQVHASVPLPEEFNLLLVEANSSRHVLLKWRAGDFAGVAFSQIEAAASSAGAGARSKPDPQRPPSPPAEASPPPPGAIRGGPENRLAPRRRVLGHCLVVGAGMRASAIIRDISATGAQLGIASRVKLPPEFHLLDPKTNSARRVALRWREGDLVGVQFCEASAPTAKEETMKDVPSIWHV